MNSEQTDWGTFIFTLTEYLEKNNWSKNKLASCANLQRTQLNSYCNNKVQRPDFGVLSRICCVLNCEISDIVKYIPPKEKFITKELKIYGNKGGDNNEIK